MINPKQILNPKLQFLIFATLLSAFSYAQEDKSKREIDYVTALAKKGWFDWADEKIANLEGGVSTGNKAGVEFLKATVKAEMANHETDAAKQEELVKEALALLEAFIKDNPDSPKALEANLKAGDILLDTAENIRTKKMTADEKDTMKLAKLKETADAYYKSAAEKFAKIADMQKEKDIKARVDLDDKAQQKGVSSDDLQFDEDNKKIEGIEIEQMNAEYKRARSIYLRGLLYPKDDAQWKDLLTAANTYLNQFRLDWGGYLISGDAAILQGMCRRELGAADDAIKNDFSAAIDVKEHFKDEKTGKYNLSANPDAADIISRAYYFKADTLLTFAKDNKGAADTVDELIKLIPDIAKERMGKASMIIKAKALANMGELKIARGIVEPFKDDPIFAGAVEAILVYTAGVSTDLKSMADDIDIAYKRGENDKVIELASKAIPMAQRDKEADKYLPDLYYKCGNAFFAKERFREAVKYYQDLCTKYTKHELGPKAAAKCLNCLHKVVTQSPNSVKDKKAYDDWIAWITKNYPTEPETKIVPYLQAESLEDRKDFLGAAGAYLLIGQDTPLYENARVKAGYCYRLHAKHLLDIKDIAQAKVYYNKAMEVLTDYLQYAKTSPALADTEKQDNRLNNMFNSYLMIANTYMADPMKDPKKAIEALGDTATTLAKAPEKLDKIRVTAITALLMLESLDEAVKLVEVVGKQNPNLPGLVNLYRDIAVGYDKIAEELKNKGDKNQFFEKTKTAVKYYKRWLSKALTAEKLAVGDLVLAGDRLFLMGMRLNDFYDNNKAERESFIGIDVAKIKDKSAWDAASDAYDIAEAKAKEKGEAIKDEWKLKLKHARSLVLLGKPQEAMPIYEKMVKDGALLLQYDRGDLVKGQIDTQIASQKDKGYLMSAYEELGEVYILNSSTNTALLDRASEVFNNIYTVSEEGTERWWSSRFNAFNILYLKGGAGDFEKVSAGISMMERNYKNFDGNKYGYKDRFLELKKKLAK